MKKLGSKYILLLEFSIFGITHFTHGCLQHTIILSFTLECTFYLYFEQRYIRSSVSLLDRQSLARRYATVTSYEESREVYLLVNETRKRFAAIITFRKSNKTHQCYSISWKCCSPYRMNAVQLGKTFTFRSSCPEIIEISRRTLIAHQPPIFSS